MKKSDLPKFVEIKDRQYQYRHYIPSAQRATTKIPHDSIGRTARVILCPVTASDAVFYAALAAAKQSFEMQADAAYLSLRWLHEQWTEHVPAGNMSGSRAFKGLAPATQKRYRSSEAILDHVLKIDGKDSTLGDVRADHIGTATIRKILDKRYHDGAGTSKLNNELAMLGSMYKFAKQYLPELNMTASPTKGIEKFKTTSSERYVTDQEYNIQYTTAGEVNRPYLQDYMELTYLLAARGCEISSLKIGAATEQGIIVSRTKGSLNTGIIWTPRLRKVWDKAMARHLSSHPDPHKNIIVTDKGHEISKSAIDDAWGLVRAEMTKRGLKNIYFTAHALKFKGISDAENKALAGQSEAMQRRYKVNVDWFDGPS